ncbi:hypothetical protein GCM10020366_09260 [Saccharopolyspora gregorii]|uniref:Uncharacterized protein n=1 Tax=Saccharopolyspora gregorii TaxID=33914 RepID=A0ABP6RKK5_9PSEU
MISAPGLEGMGSWQGMVEAVDRWIDADGLRFGPADRIELGYGAHSAYTLPPEALRRIGESVAERQPNGCTSTATACRPRADGERGAEAQVRRPRVQLGRERRPIRIASPRRDQRPERGGDQQHRPRRLRNVHSTAAVTMPVANDSSRNSASASKSW